MATLWRTAVVSISVGYVALLIPWTTFIWNQAQQIVKKPDEVFLLGEVGIAGVFAVSIYVVFCIIYESFRKANQAADLLLERNLREPRGN